MFLFIKILKETLYLSTLSKLSVEKIAFGHVTAILSTDSRTRDLCVESWSVELRAALSSSGT